MQLIGFFSNLKYNNLVMPEGKLLGMLETQLAVSWV
jgi:hypothetical protein